MIYFKCMYVKLCVARPQRLRWRGQSISHFGNQVIYYGYILYTFDDHKTAECPKCEI